MTTEFREYLNTQHDLSIVSGNQRSNSFWRVEFSANLFVAYEGPISQDVFTGKTRSSRILELENFYYIRLHPI